MSSNETNYQNNKQRLITDYFYSNKKDNQKRITDYFKPPKIHGYNSKTDSWHCLICGIDMGPQNPRQLCGKWRCIYQYDTDF